MGPVKAQTHGVTLRALSIPIAVLNISELPVLCASVSKQVFVPNLLFENELIDLYENEPVGVTHSHMFRIGFTQRLMLTKA